MLSRPGRVRPPGRRSRAAKACLPPPPPPPGAPPPRFPLGPAPRAPPAGRETQLRLELANGSRVVCLPGREGTIRSFGGVALLVLDEAARIPDALYRSVRPMLAVSGGRLVALSTPFGRRGWFWQEWE